MENYSFIRGLAVNKGYRTFSEFYPFYLSQHQHKICRVLHYIGSSLVIMLFAYICLSQRWSLMLLLPIIGYGFAWVGHFVFEKNRPATFEYPLYSFMADWVMLFQAITKRN
ncbi:Mpo1-like protein [Shewanella fidelis]|uniref:Mpo1-like protein n=1 Tax=Shewanella fidelis TaxID=173509 RepID=UPI000D5924F5